MNPLAIGKLVVVGTGLLGGSLGLAIRRSGCCRQIVGVGRNVTTLDKARAAGCIDEGTTDLAAAVSGADLIVLATPVGAIVPYLEKLAPLVEPGTIITDVGSTKAHIVAAAEAVLPHPGRFVGSHPMAGSECQGPEHADAQLFRDRPVIVTATNRTDAQAAAAIESLWQMLGMRLVRMSPDQHDRLVARISHLPHLAAALLVQLASRDGGLEVASTGFASTTRIAAGDPQLWADIFLDNRDGVLDALGEFEQLAADFRRILTTGDRAALLALLGEAQRRRTTWGGSQTGID